jgi:hypothetical protein
MASKEDVIVSALSSLLSLSSGNVTIKQKCHISTEMLLKVLTVG